ncbi:MAG: YraN family protein [Pseudomonadota bacterium]
MTFLRRGNIKRGQQAEEIACQYLQEQGLQLLGRNYRCPCGEIDLIMAHHDGIVFVEVRYRKNQHFGSGAESVDHFKQSKIIASAAHYLQKNKGAARRPARFDVVAVAPDAGQHKIEWIRDAFQA